MKKAIILIILCISIQSYSQFFPIDTMRLNSSYRELVNKPNTIERQQIFFDSFPSTWNEFILTYQYVPDTSYDLSMYRLVNNHINALGGYITLIDDSIYCDKLIKISIGGIWDVDAPNHLQNLLHRNMNKKMDSMIERLSKLPKGQQMQFWQFYWSSLYKKKIRKTEFLKINKLLIDRYPNEMKTMAIAFQYFNGGIIDIEKYPKLRNEIEPAL